MRPSELTGALGLNHDECQIVQINTRFSKEEPSSDSSKRDDDTTDTIVAQA